MRARDPEKQQRIKEAMVSLILREGINGASVSKIAREAGVSPATIYIYYASKEDMMAEVFRECAHQSYQYLMRRMRPQMSAGELIEAIVRGSFSYSVEHEEMFSFVEQCSRCPTLSPQVAEEDCGCDVFVLIHLYQERGEMRRCSDLSLRAVLFPPVRYIAENRASCGESAELQLEELIGMLKDMLLT